MYCCKPNCQFVQDSVTGSIDSAYLDFLIHQDSPHKIRIPQYSRVRPEGIPVVHVAPFLPVSHVTVSGAGGLLQRPARP